LYFPNGTEGIPDWFEHQNKGNTISFWFRKKIPSVTFIIILPKDNWVDPKVYFFVNGYEIEIGCYPEICGHSGHTCFFHMKLEEHNEFCRQYEYNMDKGLLKNEWIHLEFKFKINWNLNLSEDEKNKILRSAQMGIHELMEKSNREEENVIFTNPYISKDKIK